MTYWIRKLQVQLGIKETGVFDNNTLDSVKHIIAPPSQIIKLLQEFFNKTDANAVSLIISGEWDGATIQRLTLFQKDYSSKYKQDINEYSKLNESTWELISKVANNL